MKKWTIEDSKELYNINGWGTSYFGINEEGNVFVTPCKNEVQIDLREVMDELSCLTAIPRYPRQPHRENMELLQESLQGVRLQGRELCSLSH